MDSRPVGTGANGRSAPGQGGSSQGGSGQGEPAAPAAPGGPLAGVIPPGFAGRVTLTIPAATLLDLADRPGEMGGIGPVDPNPRANTSDCYRSQVRADPARAAHPPRPDLPHRHGILLNRLSEVGATAGPRRGTPGMTATRESMDSRQARRGGSA